MPAIFDVKVMADMGSVSVADVGNGLVKRLPAAPYDDEQGKALPSTYFLKAATLDTYAFG